MRLLITLILALGLAALRAQPAGGAPAERPEARRFDEQRLAELRAAYDYDRDLRRAPSWWELLKDWILRRLERMLGSSAGSFVVKNLAYIIAVIAVAAAIVIIRRNGLSAAFHGAPRSAAQVIAEEEDIRALDLPALIREAEAAGNLRQAIRLRYLQVLRRLVEQGLLEWRPDRTDRDYLRQLRDPALRERFAHAALVFQWVWYGHAEVDGERYHGLIQPFIQFEQAPAR
ncbi:MAG: DUF4129 domain-containing protein [Flavobacteriales bacterium]